MSNLKLSLCAIVSMVACGSFQAKPVTWNVMPETESALIQDSRWHQLSSKEKSVMLEVVNNDYNKSKLAQLLQDDVVTYQKLSSLYDLLALAVKNNNETFLFFLLSQGSKVTDLAINAAYDVQIEKFLEFGLSPNHKLSNGDTMLINAMKAKNWNVARALLYANADLSLTDSMGKKAFDYVTMKDIDNYCFKGTQSVFYKHLTFLQKVKAVSPCGDTVMALAVYGTMAYCAYTWATK
ncbi:MAG: hypothetical protein NTZ68_00255 [Candidatus Dependentiae bacterium]|nr:hypothetical protein [Candidatus Dependentiae bacterium]